VPKENKNITLQISDIWVDIYFHDDESFINEYAYRMYSLNITNYEIEPFWNKGVFITMWETYPKYFNEAKRVLRKLKLKKLYDTESTTM
jgi:hypothetical protein